MNHFEPRYLYTGIFQRVVQTFLTCKKYTVNCLRLGNYNSDNKWGVQSRAPLGHVPDIQSKSIRYLLYLSTNKGIYYHVFSTKYEFALN